MSSTIIIVTLVIIIIIILIMYVRKQSCKSIEGMTRYLSTPKQNKSRLNNNKLNIDKKESREKRKKKENFDEEISSDSDDNSVPYFDQYNTIVGVKPMDSKPELANCMPCDCDGIKKKKKNKKKTSY